MPPKKKGNKKADDDWEADLGETIDPIAAATNEAREKEAVKDAEEEDEAVMGGGLMAALKKNRSKKQKKGKAIIEDFVDGEEIDTNGPIDVEAAANNLAANVPEEPTAEDLFEAPIKGKGGKGKQAKAEEFKGDEDGDAEDQDGKLKSKKEKEKEKKEREKQRKKEQVCDSSLIRRPFRPCISTDILYVGSKEENACSRSDTKSRSAQSSSGTSFRARRGPSAYNDSSQSRGCQGRQEEAEPGARSFAEATRGEKKTGGRASSTRCRRESTYCRRRAPRS